MDQRATRPAAQLTRSMAHRGRLGCRCSQPVRFASQSKEFRAQMASHAKAAGNCRQQMVLDNSQSQGEEPGCWIGQSVGPASTPYKVCERFHVPAEYGRRSPERLCDCEIERLRGRERDSPRITGNPGIPCNPVWFVSDDSARIRPNARPKRGEFLMGGKQNRGCLPIPCHLCNRPL